MSNNIHFIDRTDAGRQLAELLINYKNKNAVIFALPRGGVILGKIIAQKLNCPLDLLIPRKIGHPYNPEYAIGAIAETGELVGNKEELINIDKNWLKKEIEKEKKEAIRRRNIYLKNKKPINVQGKIAIIVDDGIATGLTMLAAIKELKHQNPSKIIVAAPISPKDTAEKIKKEVDNFISISIPEYFLGAIGAYYDDFSQVTDEEVIKLMEQE